MATFSFVAVATDGRPDPLVQDLLAEIGFSRGEQSVTVELRFEAIGGELTGLREGTDLQHLTEVPLSEVATRVGTPAPLQKGSYNRTLQQGETYAAEAIFVDSAGRPATEPIRVRVSAVTDKLADKPGEFDGIAIDGLANWVRVKPFIAESARFRVDIAPADRYPDRLSRLETSELASNPALVGGGTWVRPSMRLWVKVTAFDVDGNILGSLSDDFVAQTRVIDAEATNVYVQDDADNDSAGEITLQLELGYAQRGSPEGPALDLSKFQKRDSVGSSVYFDADSNDRLTLPVDPDTSEYRLRWLDAWWPLPGEAQFGDSSLAKRPVLILTSTEDDRDDMVPFNADFETSRGYVELADGLLVETPGENDSRWGTGYWAWPPIPFTVRANGRPEIELTGQYTVGWYTHPHIPPP